MSTDLSPSPDGTLEASTRRGSRAVHHWNHNTHYHPVVFDAIPRSCRRALDVGCGEGQLTRELRDRVPEVIGIDSDARSIAIARAHPRRRDIEYIHADVLVYEFEPASFDLVTAVASLHHMPTVAALSRLRWLLRPSGVLVVIGLAHPSPREWPLHLAAIVPHHLRRLRGGYRQHPSPIVWPPPEGYRSMHRIAARVLPGARFRRRLYWRYTLVWVNT